MSTLGPEARALVDAGRSALRPTNADRERVLGALLARMPAAGVIDGSAVDSGAAHGGAPTLSGDAVEAVASKGIGWLVLSGAVVGLGVVGAVLLWQPGQADAPPAAPQVAVPAETPIQVPEVEKKARPSMASPSPLASAAAEEPEPAAKAAARAPSDRLAEEVAILSRAETALHAGRFAGALSALDEHQRKFPRGVLSQERVAVRIHALCGLGRVAEAEAAFRSLNRLSPRSPHGGHTKAACAAKQSK